MDGRLAERRAVTVTSDLKGVPAAGCTAPSPRSPSGGVQMRVGGALRRVVRRLDTRGGARAAAGAAGAVILCAGCGGAARQVAIGPEAQAVDRLLAAHPAEAGRNVSPVLLHRSERSSCHLVYVRDRERPHFHATHDLLVTVVEGEGTLWIAGTPIAMRAGDVAAVEAGTPHHFVNGGRRPAAAFVVFSPPSDGSDHVFVDGP